MTRFIRGIVALPLTGLALAACTSEAPVASEPEIARPAFNTTTINCSNGATVDSVAFNWGTSYTIPNPTTVINPDGSAGYVGTNKNAVISEGLNVASSGGSLCDVLNFSGSTSTGAPLTVYRTTGKLGVGAATATDDWISSTEWLTVSFGSALANRVATTAWVNLRGSNNNTKAAVQPLLDGLPVGTEVLIDAGLTPDKCTVGSPTTPCLGRAARIVASNGGVFNAIRIRANSTIPVSVSGGGSWPAPVIAFKLSNISRCGTGVCRLDWNSESNSTSWVQSFAQNGTTPITTDSLGQNQLLRAPRSGPSSLMRFSTGAWLLRPRLGVVDDWISSTEALSVWLGSAYSVASVSTGRAATSAVVNLRGQNANGPATIQPMLDDTPVGDPIPVTAGLIPEWCHPNVPNVPCEGRQLLITRPYGVLFNGIRIRATTSVNISVSGGSSWPRPAMRFNFF